MTNINIGAITEALNNKVDLDGSWGTPSSQYDELTLGASGTEYMAPADGWFLLSKNITANGQYINFNNMTSGIGAVYIGYTTGCKGSCFAKFGEVVSITYNAGGTTAHFKFIYAQKSN